MSKKIIAVAISMILVLAFTACGEKELPEAEFGWGVLENGRYENEFFKFSMNISPDYSFLTPQEIVNMNSQSIEDEPEVIPVDINSIEDLSTEALVHYVYATKYSVAIPGQFNPYVNIFSENMRYVNNIYNKEAYVQNSLGFTKMIFTDAGVDVEVFPLEKLWFGDRQLAKGSMKIDYDEFTMFQDMYAYTKGNYAFVILAGYSNAAEKTEIDDFINSIIVK